MKRVYRGRKYYKNQIDKLVDYCFEQGYSVDFTDKEDEAFPDENFINIYKNQSAENRFFSLLHEISHLEIHRNLEEWERDFAGQKYPKYTQIYKISALEEEFVAWRRGLILSEKLNLYVNKKKYMKLKAKCLCSHIKNLFGEK